MFRDRAFLGLLLLGLVIRVGAALVLGLDGPLEGDEIGYAAVARSLATGDGFSLPIAERAGIDVPPLLSFRAPGLPLVLAPFAAAGAGALVLRLVCLVLGALGGALLHRALAAGPLGRWSVAAGAAYAVWPPAVYVSLRVLSEPLALALLLGAVGLVLRAARDEDGRPAAAGGLVAGLAVLTRPGLVPVALLLALCAGSRRRGGLVVLALAAVMAPWLVRSVHHHGRPLLTTNSGVTFVGGNSAAAAAAEPPGKWLPPDVVYGTDAGAPDLGMWGWSALGEAGSDARFRSDGLDWIAGHPAEAARLAGAKVVRLFDPDPHSGRADAGLKRLVGWATLVPVLLLALAGVLPAIRAGPAVRPWFACLAGTVLMAIVFYGDTRMRAAADPALIVLAALGARSAWRRFAPSRTEP